ncbi:MAG: toxin-antitoxin system YwqK family antitoxin [Candidatus Binataceae bacterium]
MAAVIGAFAITAAGVLTACNRSHAIALSCPPGAQMRGAPPPKSDELWCEKIINGRPVKDGPFVVFNDNGGKMIEGNYVDGKQNGLWTMHYLNGQREAIDHYRDGAQNGLHISWYANGAKAIEGEYRNGQREGVWTRWDPNGLRATKERYHDGKKIS